MSFSDSSEVYSTQLAQRLCDIKKTSPCQYGRCRHWTFHDAGPQHAQWLLQHLLCLLGLSTSKLRLKIFQLGLQRGTVLSNLLMKAPKTLNVPPTHPPAPCELMVAVAFSLFFSEHAD